MSFGFLTESALLPAKSKVRNSESEQRSPTLFFAKLMWCSLRFSRDVRRPLEELRSSRVFRSVARLSRPVASAAHLFLLLAYSTVINVIRARFLPTF